MERLWPRCSLQNPGTPGCSTSSPPRSCASRPDDGIVWASYVHKGYIYTADRTRGVGRAEADRRGKGLPAGQPARCGLRRHRRASASSSRSRPACTGSTRGPRGSACCRRCSRAPALRAAQRLRRRRRATRAAPLPSASDSPSSKATSASSACPRPPPATARGSPTACTSAGSRSCPERVDGRLRARARRLRAGRDRAAHAPAPRRIRRSRPPRRSLRTRMAALWPQAAITPPPGCVPAPHR
jgi:hypothetical protein